ncbi:MAG: PTS sugar transporter subunit IIC, partial [Clostridia bacterium]|nr:PTS sugar transporter subunit IIC [Clostridia bacterium]
MDEKPIITAEEEQKAQVEEVVSKSPQNQNGKNQNKFWTFTKKLSKRWFIDAFTGMAQGLFVTLIAGTIFVALGQYVFTDKNAVGRYFIIVGRLASILMGAGIGAGIAHRLKMPPLVIFSAIVAGLIGAWADTVIKAGWDTTALSTLLNSIFYPATADAFGVSVRPGNPIGAYVTALLVCEITKLVAGKTKLDIILVPLVAFIVAVFGAFLSWPFIQLVNLLGKAIAYATYITPFFMGIIVAVIMGILLTLPTSSAAIWVAIAAPIIATGETWQVQAMYIAGGAATVGCACQMVGFAVMSFKENGWGGLVSQGLGTSMLQIPNVMRNPRILLPPVIASVICGPLSTCVFKLACGPSGGGMGTCGFVGVIETFSAYKQGGGNLTLTIFGVILL